MSRTRGADAMQRAAKAWGEAALESRGALRTRGVRGNLRVHDDYAAGRRGVGVAKGFGAMAVEMRDAGVDPVEITARLQHVVGQMVAAVCAIRDEHHGPRAA